MSTPRPTPQPTQQRSVSAALHRATQNDQEHWFRLVTPAVDNHGTVIRPEGVKTERFAANPVFLWMHESGGGYFGGAPLPDVVIGKVIQWEQDETRFDICVEFDTAPLAAECLRKVKADLIRMVSIGFNPLREHTEEIEGRNVVVYDEVELIECSLVIVGSNPEALALKRSLDDLAAEAVERAAATVFRVDTSPYLTAMTEVVAETIKREVEKALTRAARETDVVGQPAPGAFTSVAEGPAVVPVDKDKKGRTMPKMNAEARYVMRRALSQAMDAADMHTYGMGVDGTSDELKALHRSMASESLSRASMIVKALRADHEEPDGDEGFIRSVPAGADADIATLYAEVVDGGKGLFIRSVGQVVKGALGVDDADEVEAKIEALKLRSDRYEEMRKAERTDAKARESAERERILSEMLSGGIITPALANKARGIDPATGQPGATPWSVAKIERFRAEAGEPVVTVTRVAPLTRDGGGIAPPVVEQPAPPVESVEVPAEVLEFGKMAGLPEDLIRRNYVEQAKKMGRR